MRRPLSRGLFICLAGVTVIAVGLGAATLAFAGRDTVCALLRPIALDRLLASCGSPEARALLVRGRQAMEAKDFRRALTHFRNATAAAPDFVAALLAQGEAAETLGELDEALTAYTRAAALDPSLDTRTRLGSVAEDSGKVELAVDAYQGAADQGAPEGAVAWLERAVAIDPDSWRTHRNLGKALAILGRVPEAEAHLHRTVELFPDDVGGRLALARVLSGACSWKAIDATLTADVFAWRDKFSRSAVQSGTARAPSCHAVAECVSSPHRA